MSQYMIEAGTGQHIGNREEQQDRIALFSAPKAPGYMMAVLADGVGGKSGGTLAAQQVIITAKQVFDEFVPEDDVVSLIETVIRESHIIIRLSGMSSEKEPHTTVVILIITPHQRAVWAHVGDSRLYRFSGSDCIERTIDHSYVEKLISENKITPEEAKSHASAHVLINVLGSKTTEPFITIDECSDLKPHDSFLLCSDGLWHYFNDQELGAIISVNSPRTGAEMLIKKTQERAAECGDNCSMAIIKVVEHRKK